MMGRMLSAEMAGGEVGESSETENKALTTACRCASRASGLWWRQWESRMP